MILNQRVYIISGAVVRGLMERRVDHTGRGVYKSSVIDGNLLADDMLRAAARRRYLNSEKGFLQEGRERLTAAISWLRLGSDTSKSSTFF